MRTVKQETGGQCVRVYASGEPVAQSLVSVQIDDWHIEIWWRNVFGSGGLPSNAAGTFS